MPAKPEFDAFAQDYDQALNQGLSISGEDKNYFARGRLQWLARRLNKHDEHPRRILDFGCGTGSSTPFFSECLGDVQHVLGTDVSEQSLTVARRDHGGTGTAGRAEFRLMSDWAPDGSMDLAFCNGVFHHIPIAERPACVKYIHDALRPGGLFALWENNPWSPAARYVMSRIPFDRDAIMLWPAGLRRLLRQAGFDILSTDYRFIFPSLLAWLRPLETLVTKAPLGTQYLVLGRRRG
jgi:SAM-dependent methyltransferase